MKTVTLALSDLGFLDTALMNRLPMISIPKDAINLHNPSLSSDSTTCQWQAYPTRTRVALLLTWLKSGEHIRLIFTQIPAAYLARLKTCRAIALSHDRPGQHGTGHCIIISPVPLDIIAWVKKGLVPIIDEVAETLSKDIIRARF